MPRVHVNTITPDTFKDILTRYPSVVPDKLRDLDTLRYDTIPASVVQEQGKGKGKAVSLAKEQVEKLVEWKLYALLVVGISLC